MKNRKAVRKYIEKHEGRKKTTYLDSRGIPTIGVGINLEEAKAKKRIEALGLNYQDVLNKKVSLSDAQIDKLLDEELDVAITDAKSYYKDFDQLDAMRQIILVDMAFNLGGPRLRKFKKVKEALEKRDYKEAAKEIENSLYYKQVKSRGKRNVLAMQDGKMPFKDIIV